MVWERPGECGRGGMVDARDLKLCGVYHHAGLSPAIRTTAYQSQFAFKNCDANLEPIAHGLASSSVSVSASSFLYGDDKMADTLISFEFKIKRGRKVVKNGDFCIDANDYLCTHLKCEEDELDDVLERTSREKIIEIAEWAYEYCDYMNSLLRDYSGEIESSIAEEEAKISYELGSDEYDELYQEIIDQLICKVSSVEIIIDGKNYKGK